MILDTPHFKIFFHSGCIILAQNDEGNSWFWQLFREWKEVVLPTDMSQETLDMIAQIAEGRK